MLQNRGLVLAVLLLLGLALLAPFLLRGPEDDLNYSTFISDGEAGRVEAVRLAGRQISAQYKGSDQAVVLRGPQDKSDLLQRLDRQGVEVVFTRPSDRGLWASLLSGALPLMLMVGWLVLMTNQSSGAGNQLLQFGRSKARLATDQAQRVTMEDVAGMPEVKEELAEVIDFLRTPDRYLAMGARIPKGVLLSGPPGTGKTLLAKAVAGEAGVPFFSASGSEFVEMFAGVGASRVRDLFERAKQSSPCIVFVDEIDAVGRHRGGGLGGTNDEREQTLNQLLVEMDGFASDEGVIVMAATNRIDILDPAILRPGRFDRQIILDLPDSRGRAEILKVHSRSKPMADDVDLAEISHLTVGFTGADLANLLNEAALLAARRKQTTINRAALVDAYERIATGGVERRRTLREDERARLAYHEAGHAVVAVRLPGGHKVSKVSIIGRGRAAGYTMYQQEDDKYLYSASDFESHIARLLAGRAAEELVLGEISTGAADDLERATSLARTMVTELGMSESLGPVRLAHDDEVPLVAMGMRERSISDRTTRAIDESVKRLIHDGYQRARDVLVRHRQGLERLAHALLERETLEGHEVEAIIAAAPVTA